MRNSPQYNPEFVGSDSKVIMETEFLKLQKILAEVTASIEKIVERVDDLEKNK